MFRIRNIKISLKVKPLVLNNALKRLEKKSVTVKTYSNFISFKANTYTYVLFKKGKTKQTHINITQIPSLDLVKTAINIIVRLLKCCVLNYTIDNIIATSDLHKCVCLMDVVIKKSFERIKYNNEIFPGLFIKFINGTVIVFHTGKIVIVGCKNKESIKWILETVCANI